LFCGRRRRTPKRIERDLDSLLLEIAMRRDGSSVPSFDPERWRIPTDLPAWKRSKAVLARLARVLSEAAKAAWSLDPSYSSAAHSTNMTAYYALSSQYINQAEPIDVALGTLESLASAARRASRLGPQARARSKRGGRRPSFQLDVHADAVAVCADYYRKHRANPDARGGAFDRKGRPNNEFGEDVLIPFFQLAFGFDRDQAVTAAHRAWRRARASEKPMGRPMHP
jgi:hypothetical protein